jgi:hypothetical protein
MVHHSGFFVVPDELASVTRRLLAASPAISRAAG